MKMGEEKFIYMYINDIYFCNYELTNFQLHQKKKNLKFSLILFRK